MALALPSASADNSLALRELVDRAYDYAAASKAQSTLRAYRSDWAHFETWCQEHELQSLPAAPSTVAMYVSDCVAHYKAATIGRRLVSVSLAHKTKGLKSPTKDPVVEATWRGVRRAIGVAPAQKTALMTEQLRRMLETLPTGIRGVRDRAMLLLGFAGGFRRSEIVGLNLADVRFTPEGATVNLCKSKTDQEGRGRTVGLPYGSDPGTCPVRSLQAWIDAAQRTAGALFLSIDRHDRVTSQRAGNQAVVRAIKRYATAIGLDASAYAGHSLRSGLATQAALNGASERAIMNQTGHRSVMMVRRYIRDGSLWQENAAAKLGL